MTREEIIRLPPPERLALIADLWDSLSDADLPLSVAQENELQSRLESFDIDRQHGISWDKLRSERKTRTP